MPTTDYVTELPDPIYGRALVGHSAGSQELNVSTMGGSNMLHAFIGDIYVAMSERNWGILFASLQRLDITVPAPTTHRINFDDANGTATTATTIKRVKA